MAKKPKVTKNKAKDIEKPKTKLIDIPDTARAEIAFKTQELNSYLAGVAAGLDIKGKWSFDARTMKFVIREN